MVKQKIIMDKEMALLLETKDTKGLSAYIGLLRHNENLQKYWFSIENLQKEAFDDRESALEFINENIALAKTIDMSQIAPLGSQIEIGDLGKVESSINTILFEGKTPKTLKRHKQALEVVVENMLKNGKKRRIAESLSLGTDPISSALTLSDDNFFETIKSKGISTLNEMLESENDPQQKLLLYEAKEKLQKSEVNFDNLDGVVELLL